MMLVKYNNKVIKSNNKWLITGGSPSPTPHYITCPDCGGTGIDENNTEMCPTCNGSGQDPNDAGTQMTCDDCGGSGQVDYGEGSEPCPTCGGSGEIWMFAECPECGGSGIINGTCQTCNGTGQIEE